MKKVLVAISGGVDSSAVAMLLKEKGYEIIGVHMRLGFNDSKGESAARAVCNKLGIKFYPVNLSEKFNKEVIDYFLQSYKNGLTPNPCVKCNKYIKFGELLKLVDQLDADYLATGHYIKKKVEKKSKNNICRLYKGKDNNKDQSYFLYNLTQEQLSKIIFPLGDSKKDEIKKITEKIELPHLKGESQDVCFLNVDGKIMDHNDYLKIYLDLKSGPIKTMGEEIIGEHKGLPLYTIGQRRGVEIGGTGPYYVAKTDYKTNTLYVVNDINDNSLFSGSALIENVNFICNEKIKLPLECEAVIRYRHKPIKCVVENTQKEGQLKVTFKEKQRAVTPGQSLVLYDGEELLGGGIIVNE